MTNRSYATFNGYLEAEQANGVIDFSLRLVRGPKGELDFYIHPANVGGETGDFTVSGNVVLPIEDGHGAGSRPSAKVFDAVSPQVFDDSEGDDRCPRQQS